MLAAAIYLAASEVIDVIDLDETCDYFEGIGLLAQIVERVESTDDEGVFASRESW